MSIETMTERMNAIVAGSDPQVKPGQPERFTTAAVAGDAIRQGDLYIMVIDSMPKGYAKIANQKFTEQHRQLVPGNTQGAKHCLDSLEGVQMWHPNNYGEESLNGPCLKLSQERIIQHPTHGSVTIPAGMMVQCFYQREYDAEQQRARRAAD